MVGGIGMKWLRKIFKKRKSLRDKLIEMYGEEAGICYDETCQGRPIGGFLETAAFVTMVEERYKSIRVIGEKYDKIFKYSCCF